MGYGLGLFAPGRCSDHSRCGRGDSAREVYVVAHHVLLAHAKVVDMYRREFKDSTRKEGGIGIVLNLDWGEPLDKNSDVDVKVLIYM